MNWGVELPASKRALIAPGIWDERRRGEGTCSGALPCSNSYCGTAVRLSANWILGDSEHTAQVHKL